MSKTLPVIGLLLAACGLLAASLGTTCMEVLTTAETFHLDDPVNIAWWFMPNAFLTGIVATGIGIVLYLLSSQSRAYMKGATQS